MGACAWFVQEIENLSFASAYQPIQGPWSNSCRCNVVLIADAQGHDPLLIRLVLPFNEALEHVVDGDMSRCDQQHALAFTCELQNQLANRRSLA
ncbi:hypothetical protein D3C86_2046160 [compost metagenome]